jgi:hypothetical protein
MTSTTGHDLHPSYSRLVLAFNPKLVCLGIKRQESELFYNYRFTANQFVYVLSSLCLIFTLNQCGLGPYGTSSQTRANEKYLAFVRCKYHTSSTILKMLSFTVRVYTSPLSVQALQYRPCLSYLSYTTMAT